MSRQETQTQHIILTGAIQIVTYYKMETAATITQCTVQGQNIYNMLYIIYAFYHILSKEC